MGVQSDDIVGSHSSTIRVKRSSDIVCHRSYGTEESQRPLSQSQFRNGDDPTIPPPDHGIAAWLFLFGCFWLDGLVWGLPFAFGVFENYYTNHETFSSQPHIASIGTTGLGAAYLIVPLNVVVLHRWPAYRKQFSVLGLILITVALVAASFATQVVHLILTQGLFYGLGASLVYSPFTFYIDQWFVKRKGLAYGVFWAGTGFCGSITPTLMEWALHNYGYRITLRVWALVLLLSLSSLIHFVRPRLDLRPEGDALSLDLGFLRTPLFWVFQSGNLLQGFGNFIPSVYIPMFASDVGMPDSAGTIGVSLLNVASVLGMILIGALTDHYHISTVLLVSALGSAFSVFFLWGFAVTELRLYAFVLLYGVFAGGYTSTWSGCSTEVRQQTPGTEVAVLMGIMAFGRGFGCLSSGPLSDKLLNLGLWQGVEDGGAYGTEYANLVAFTGTTALLSGVGLIARFRKRLPDPNPGLEETRPLIP